MVSSCAHQIPYTGCCLQGSSRGVPSKPLHLCASVSSWVGEECLPGTRELRTGGGGGSLHVIVQVTSAQVT